MGEEIEDRRNQLKAVGVRDLKQLLTENGLQASGKLPDMVNTQLTYEKRIKDEYRAYEAKVKEMTEQKKTDFEGLTPCLMLRECKCSSPSKICSVYLQTKASQ